MILYEEGRCDWVIKRRELRNEQALPESSSVGLFGMIPTNVAGIGNTGLLEKGSSPAGSIHAFFA